MSSEVYGYFWVLLSYFVGFVFLAIWIVKGFPNYIFYSLFFILLGLLLNISFKLSILLDMFHNSTIEVVDEWGDD